MQQQRGLPLDSPSPPDARRLCLPCLCVACGAGRRWCWAPPCRCSCFCRGTRRFWAAAAWEAAIPPSPLPPLELHRRHRQWWWTLWRRCGSRGRWWAASSTPLPSLPSVRSLECAIKGLTCHLLLLADVGIAHGGQGQGREGIYVVGRLFRDHASSIPLNIRRRNGALTRCSHQLYWICGGAERFPG